MDDTSPQVKEIMKKLWQGKTPGERLAMGCSMFDFAKELVRSNLRQEHAGIPLQTERQELFLRFYGDQFTPTQKEKILKHLLQTTTE